MGHEQSKINGPSLRETELYGPVKAFLEAAGYDVKAEIGAADVMALRDGSDPVCPWLR